MIIKKIQILTLVLFIFSILTFPQENPNGLEIIKKVYNRPAGNDQSANLTMALIDSHGNKRVREIKQFLKDDKDVEKRIMFFVSPADVRNTSFMNWSYGKY